MADTPDPDAPRTPRMPPRAARLSRLTQPATAPDEAVLSQPPSAPAAPPPPVQRATAPIEPVPASGPRDDLSALAAVVASGPQSAAGALPNAAAQVGLPDARPATVEHTGGGLTFKPISDPQAARAVMISGFGLVLCIFPVLSLAGLVWGALSMRRITASKGTLVGMPTARLAVILGLIGVVVGVAFDIYFALS